MCEGISQAAVAIDALQGLHTLLASRTPPAQLATFDISHLYGSHTVGACAQLSHGVTALGAYSARQVEGAGPADDLAAIAETLRARLGGAGGAWPDCLLVDGGKAQLSAARGVLRELGLEGDVAVLALAKREEELFLPGAAAPLALARTSPTLTLLRRQRDEARPAAPRRAPPRPAAPRRAPPLRASRRASRASPRPAALRRAPPRPEKKM